jgi:cyclase
MTTDADNVPRNCSASALARLVPCLLLQDRKLVKTVRFARPAYVGDPINAVRIFNEREVDELAILDINATPQAKSPNFELIETIVSEAFMPVAYGGGIRSVDDISRLFSIGVEKAVLATAAIENGHLLAEAVQMFGSQSIVACLDIRKNLFGKYEAYTRCGTHKQSASPMEIVARFVGSGAGEVLINSIDRDGTMTGYDLKIIAEIAARVSVPVMACGGAGTLADAREAIRAGASSAAAGSMFVYHGKHRAVLINYPTSEHRQEAFEGKS